MVHGPSGVFFARDGFFLFIVPFSRSGRETPWCDVSRESSRDARRNGDIGSSGKVHARAQARGTSGR